MKLPVVEDGFPCLQDMVVLRSAIISRVFTSEVVHEQEESYPQHRL